MNCPLCNGEGEYMHECGGFRQCEHCGGTGRVPQTNEEWFTSLPTEEKVTALVNLWGEIKMKMRGELGSENKLWNGDYFREWLKEEHHEM